MVYPDSAMARCDPSSDKENLVPRVHRNEPGSGGLGSVRTRGLMSSEQRLHTVLKESALQNQTPAAVISSKANLGSTEKEWLKDVLFDYSGKQSAGSLERLKEKIGQLKSVNALKPVPLKTAAAFDHHSVGELPSRGLSPNVSEAVVHVYRDDKVSKPGGIQRETVKVESQRYHRDSNHRNISLRVHEHNLVEHDVHDVHDRGKPSSLLTPTKPSAGKENESSMQSHGSSFSRGTPFKKKPSGSDSIDNSRRSVQNKVDSGGHFTSEKQTFSSEVKSVVVQDLQGKYSLAGETSRLTSPLEEEAKSSRENSVELHAIPSSALVDKIIKRAKISSFGPALRVRRDDPRAYAKADFSPDSEKSADYDHKHLDSLHASHTVDSHANVHIMPKVSEAGAFSSGKSNQRVHQNVALQTDDDFLNEHRKRKAETDPSTTDTSHLHLAVGIDKHVSVAVATEAREVVNKGGNSVHRECEGRRGSMEKEIKVEPTALEPSGERWIEDIAGHPLTGSCTKGTPGHEREPWAWKTARDARGLTLPSPTSHEHSKSGKVIGGIPPRYVPPVLESRERKPEENDSPASDGLKHHPGVLKQINEMAKSEPINGVIPQSNLRVKGLADDNAVHHLSNTFSTISFEEKIASGVNGADKTSTQGRTQTHISEHHVISVPAESGSNTGVTGVTGLTALTSPNGLIPHKTAVTLSHGVELQQKPHSQQPPREGDLGTNLPDHSALPKSTCRATVTAAEIAVHDVNEGHSAKASDSSKDRGEKNQEIAHHNPQPARKLRAEAESQKFVFVNGVRYQKLGKIGKGGSSEVFKVIATDCSIYAVKRINLKGRDWSTAQEFYQEIKYLKALRGKRHIIQLIDSEVTNKKVLEERSESGDITEEACIYMVLEFGEIDLAGMLSAKRKEILSNNETEPDENWLRFYWQQILKAVKTIHDERIVHSDLKPANFMLVRGELKLIDFGIAKAIQNDTTNIVKENQTGTLNYMAPEAFLANQTDDDGVEIKIGRASDIWSLGCIFFQMVYGQTPFAELPLYSKIQAITNPHHRIQYPRTSNPWLLDIIKKCLTWDRRKRLRIPELLEHRFLRPQVAPYGF